MSVKGSNRALGAFSSFSKFGRSKRGTALVAAATFGLLSAAAYGQSLSVGIYVEQIGDGTTPADTGTTNNQQPLFIDALAPGGSALTQALALPTTNAFSSSTRGAITDIADESGPSSTTGFSHGILQASSDGRDLIMVGYDTATGSATNQHTIAVVDSFTGGLTVGSFTAVSAALPRSVATMDDGKHVWYQGATNGLRYISTPSTFATVSGSNVNQRVVSVFNNQLFTDGASGATGVSGTNPGIAVVGSGMPTANTAQTETYVINTGADPEQFVMLDQNATLGFNNNVNGNTQLTNLDVAYVATDNGMEKYVLNSDNVTWTKTETIAPTAGGVSGTDGQITAQLVGITYGGKDDSGNNVLYATTAGLYGHTGTSTTTEGNALMRLVDTGPTATWQLVQDSATNTWLRGAAAIDEPGDANGDFHVDSSDFAVIAANYGKAVSGGFASGDFNYDGTVNALDFNALATNFGYDPNSALPGDVPDAALGSVVPEPMGLSMLLLGGLAIGRRRSR